MPPLPRNPFAPRMGMEPPLFAGRERALKDFNILLNGTGKSLLLYGLRGYGKTVMLNHMRDVARAYKDEQAPKRWVVSSRADQIVTLGMDFERQAEMIAVDLAEKIQPGSKALSNLLRFASSIEEVGAASVSIKRQVTTPRASASAHQHIIDLFVRVAEMAKDHKCGVLLMFDELQALDSVGLSALLTALSVVPEKDQYFAMVAAGLPSVRAKCNAAFNSFDKLFEHEKLGDLAEPEVRQALQKPAQDSGKPFSTEALAKVKDIVRGYPYLVQFYGFWLWEDATGSQITLEDIERLRSAIGVRLIETFYEPKWVSCSKVAKRYLSAMASISGLKINAKIEALLGVSHGHTLRERTELLRLGLVYEVDDDHLDADMLALEFAYPFFGEYLRKEHPFSPPDR